VGDWGGRVLVGHSRLLKGERGVKDGEDCRGDGGLRSRQVFN